MKLLTTAEAAQVLGVTVRRVNDLILAGKLPAQRFGKAYAIQESDLEQVSERKTGRPAKPKAEPTTTEKPKRTPRKPKAK